ncbi:II DNA helicase [Mycena crocata]|nr:II DNA helicase [Mycena crocata]
MDPTQHPADPWIPQWLHFVRQMSLASLQDFVKLNIPSTLPLPTEYIASLNDDYKAIAIRASILVFIASNKKLVPRQYQLESTNALAHGHDCVVDSGTGSGKTLCQIIMNLLFPNTTSMTISPLKRLQILQAAEFVRWGIRTVCINEDTPKDAELWKSIENGHFQHLIVQPEQLQMYQGHLPRLARLLNVHRFVKTIARVHVDEAHNHHAAGLSHYGLPPFRPAWGCLHEFRLRLCKGTPFELLSGTFPPHVKRAVIEHLNFDPKSYVSLKLSSNRPNIVYATHRIVGNLSDFRNLDFLISDPFTVVHKCVVFHDDTQQCADAASYQDAKLPANLSKKGVVRHYHGGMSKDYLTAVFEDFCNPNGGLDVGDIDVVVDYGLPPKQSTSIQRGGRGGRRGQQAVYIVMAEPWAYTASLEAVATYSEDPDRPISGQLLKNAKKPARAGLAMILYVRDEEACLRANIRDYLADISPIALSIDKWCCDRPHPENPAIQFDKRTFFPGRFIYQDSDGGIYAGNTDEPDRVHLNPPKTRKRKAKGIPNRKVAARSGLQNQLHIWLSKAHAEDPLRAVRPVSFILDRIGIKALSTVHPDRMQTVEHVVTALEETSEWAAQWGQEVLSVISNFDTELRNETASFRKGK